MKSPGAGSRAPVRSASRAPTSGRPTAQFAFAAPAPAAGVKADLTGFLAEARRRVGGRGDRSAGGSHAVLALQRSAGNAAVGALMAAKLKSPGDQASTDIDAAIKEMRKNEPAADTVEKGLKAAKAVGIPVDLEGVKPPASALAVTITGFGPGSVPAKKPVPPPKPLAAISPLGKAAAKAPKIGGAGKGAGAGKAAALGGAAGQTGAGLATGSAPMSEDKLLMPPVAPTPTRPEADPAFTQVVGKAKGFARDKRNHPPAAAKAKEAQDAALAPPGDLAGQAKASKVDSMDAQQAGSFDKKAFIASVKAAIEAKSPKTLEEADKYKESGKAGQVKGDVKGLVSQGKQGQANDIETATEAAPDESKSVAKPVTPLVEENPGQAVAIPAVGAVPKIAPAEQTNLAAGKHEANQELAGADVDETQLAQSNEPEFQGALAHKKAAAEHADTAPGEFRKQEQQVVQQGKTEAAVATTAGVSGMQGAKGAALAKLVADKGKAKTKDETKRAEVTTKIQTIFGTTEADVKKILDGIDPKVEAAFEKGEAGARASFETYVAQKMSAFKKDRYGGWLGGYRWAKDKLVGMPDKVNEFYDAGCELYLKQMDTVISNVADIVGGDLGAAKKRIATGRAEIATYVKSLPTDLQEVGSEAATEIGDRFEQLESDVDDKQGALVDTLATKYVEARKGLDERIETLQSENKGLVDKAIGAIKAVINTIRELAAMLKNVLSRVAGVVGDIIKAPVAFLGNLIDGVKGGILKFKDNILDHLRKGLMGWLFGALAQGGVELPDTFDLKGVVKLLASLFGLTWTNIKNRLVKQIGQKAMDAAESGVSIFKTLASEGVGGLWELLVDKLGDIKEMILEKVQDFVITKVITAGITWLISLLNPAAAFIKACKLIYDVVMFFVENAARIAKFVHTVIDSVADVVRGNVSGVVNKINDVLGQMVPILIGFLASVLGLGGIGEKIRSIVQTLQKPVNKALDFVIKTGLKLAGPIIRKLKGVSKKVKSKVAAGKAWVKGKAKAAKKFVKKKVGAVKKKAKDIIDKFKVSVGFGQGKNAHKIYNATPGEADLTIASSPKDFISAVNDAADAAGKKEAKTLAATLITSYKSFKTRVSKVKGSARAKAVKSGLDRLRPKVELLFRLGGKVGSAPGIGSVKPYKSQPSSQREQPITEWFMENEHVIPRALTSAVFEALVPLRSEDSAIKGGGPDYKAQHTVMLYKSAANEKTIGDEADNSKSADLKEATIELGHAWLSGGMGAASATADTYTSSVMNLLSNFAADAKARTTKAIAAERASNDGVNAKRRGEPGTTGSEAPVPTSSDVNVAFTAQIADIRRQLGDRLTLAGKRRRR